LPGTSDKQRPNWRRRLSKSLEEIEKGQALSDRLGAIRRVREGLTPRG
jgi:4-alpha-glucanotransferase